MAARLIPFRVGARLATLSEESKQLLNACPACETVIDVTECAPYSKIACPDCDETIRVRRQFDHYVINAEIGEGGMSRVFRATDPSLRRQVALKILLDRFSQDDERVAQFEKEARLTASFSHPNVVKLYSVGRDQGYYFLVMEIIENGSLDELILREGRTTERQALTWVQETALGLQAAHQNGLIHRDIKPGNILLSQDRTAKLVDFGLALMFGRDRDESCEIWATPYYVPPENLRREGEDLRSDIYSLGGTLYHLLVGKPPIDVKTGSFQELIDLKAKPINMRADAPRLSPATFALVERMMAYAPSDRHGDYESLIAEIDACLDNLSSSKQVAGTGARERFLAKQRAIRKRKQRRSKITLGVLASFILAVASVWGLQLLQNTKPSSDSNGGGFIVEEDSSNPKASAAYLEGRAALLSGDFDHAASQFQQAHQAPGVSTSLQGWSLFNDGVAQLLRGNSNAAHDAFARLGLQESFAQTRLDGFFQQVCGWMTSEDIVPKAVAETVQPGFCQSIALLAYGLHDWELAAFDDAAAHFARFQEIDPGAEFDWIKDYRVLIQGHQKDLALLREITAINDLADLTAIVQKQGELKRIIDLVSTRKVQDLLTERLITLNTREAELENVAKLANAAKEKRLGRAELSKIASIAESLNQLGTELKFSEALRQMAKQTRDFKSKCGLQTIDDHRYVWTTAQDFMASLLGLKGTIRSSRRGDVNGEVLSIDATALKIKQTSGATMALSLSDVSAESLARLALHALKNTRDSNRYYQLQEQLVMFAYCTDLRQLCSSQADILAYQNRLFRDRWQRLQLPTTKP